MIGNNMLEALTLAWIIINTILLYTIFHKKDASTRLTDLENELEKQSWQLRNLYVAVSLRGTRAKSIKKVKKYIVSHSYPEFKDWQRIGDYLVKGGLLYEEKDSDSGFTEEHYEYQIKTNVSRLSFEKKGERQ